MIDCDKKCVFCAQLLSCENYDSIDVQTIINKFDSMLETSSGHNCDGISND